MLKVIKDLVKKIFGNATPATIARTVCFFLAMINQILVSTGHSIIPISNEQVETYITLTFTIVASVVAWWKNNSFTKKAVAADNYKKSLEE